MNDILSGILPAGYDEVTDLDRIGQTNFLYGGLNLLYGLDGTGKSWQTPVALKDVEDVIYLDCDGSNGSLFVKHCKDNNVHYVKQEIIESLPDKDGNAVNNTLLQQVFRVINKIVSINRKDNKEFRPVFIVDSLTSIGEGQEINNAEKIAPLLYELNNDASSKNYGLILIDHATEIKENGYTKGFKLEGNAGGKRRTTVTVNRYEPLYSAEPALGGTFTCERARGNADGLSIGNQHSVGENTLQKAYTWIKNTKINWIANAITQSEFTAATKHSKDNWIRKYKDELFISYKADRTTMLKLKEI